MRHWHYRYIISILAFLLLISCFLPWVRITERREGRVSGDFWIRGFRFALIEKSPDSKYIYGTIKTLYPGITDREIDKKGDRVWIVPFLALLILVNAWVFRRSRFASSLLVILSFSVTVYGAYKLATVDWDRIFVALVPIYGLWSTLFLFLTIGVVALINLITHGQTED